jgi:phosphoribosylaminoimidazole-succinocarboxamide synthase
MITTDLEKMPEWVREQVVKNGFEGRCMLVKKLKMIPIEAIVRGYIVGSAWKEYQSTGKVCGIELVKGLAQYEKLPEVIFTPSTKVESGHDENITFEQAEAIIGSDLAKALRAKAIEYYLAAESWARSRGIIIADTKMEFGLDENGKLVVADELFTPDCSRFWGENQSRELSYDKQLVRNYLESINFDKKTPVVLPDSVVEGTLAKYVEIYRLLTDSEPQL